jgi:predicted transcriptional regulator
MKKPHTRDQVIEMIIANPPSNASEFARKIGISKRIIAHVIKELETAGIIEPRRHRDRFLWDEAIEKAIQKKKK